MWECRRTGRYSSLSQKILFCMWSRKEVKSWEKENWLKISLFKRTNFRDNLTCLGPNDLGISIGDCYYKNYIQVVDVTYQQEKILRAMVNSYNYMIEGVEAEKNHLFTINSEEILQILEKK